MVMASAIPCVFHHGRVSLTSYARFRAVRIASTPREALQRASAKLKVSSLGRWMVRSLSNWPRTIPIASSGMTGSSRETRSWAALCSGRYAVNVTRKKRKGKRAKTK